MRSFFIVNYNTRETKKQIRFVVLRDFSFDMVQKTPLISSRYWTVTITRINIARCMFYTMELKYLHVNTLSCITEIYLSFNRLSPSLKNIAFTH
jgi:hypothetical protein